MRFWSPATAMLWESWRLTRRQLLFFGALAGLGAWALLAGAQDRDRVGYLVLITLLFVAIMALVSMSIVAGRATVGFPYTLAFGRPARTSLFVAVPMLYRAAASAAIYAIPAATLRAVYGVPFPVTPIMILLGAGAVLCLTSMWYTRDAKLRSLTAIVLGLFGVPAALQWLNSWNVPAGVFPPPVAADMVRLSVAQYALIALAVALAYFATVIGVTRQRHDAKPPRPQSPVAPRQETIAAKGFVEQFRTAALAVVRWPCPTTSPLAAELWIETKARALPVLAIGLLLAFCVPLLVLLGRQVEPQLVGIFVLTFGVVVPALPFLASVSASFWNREASLRAPMNAFEATRPIGTARLAAVQIAVAAGGILGAWAFIAASLWLSLPLVGAETSLGMLPERIAASVQAIPAGRLAGVTVVGLVVFSTVVALLATIRALAAVYGARLWVTVLGLGLYAIFVMFAVGTDRWSPAAIGIHLWALAAAIPIATAFVMVRAVVERIVRPRDAVAALAIWGAFITVCWLVARELGVTLEGLAPAIGALTLAATLLPLTASMLAPWSLGLIRHA